MLYTDNLCITNMHSQCVCTQHYISLTDETHPQYWQLELYLFFLHIECTINIKKEGLLVTVVVKMLRQAHTRST